MRDDSPPSSDDVKAGFAPIKLHNSVELHLHADPDIQRADLVKQLEYAAAGVDKGGPSGLPALDPTRLFCKTSGQHGRQRRTRLTS